MASCGSDPGFKSLIVTTESQVQGWLWELDPILESFPKKQWYILFCWIFKKENCFFGMNYSNKIKHECEDAYYSFGRSSDGTTSCPFCLRVWPSVLRITKYGSVSASLLPESTAMSVCVELCQRDRLGTPLTRQIEITPGFGSVMTPL